MPSPRRVALVGFGAFEQGALAAYLRLRTDRLPVYEPVDDAAQADFLVACADGPPPAAAAAVPAQRTVHIGGELAPAGAVSWLPRPFDPLWLLRELDVLAAMPASAPAGPAPAGPVVCAPAQREPGDARRALVVDDSEIAQRYLELQLQGLGLAVQCAGSGRQAVSLLASTAFDVVLLDIDLGPDDPLEGLALCQQIKRGPVHLGDAPPAVLLVTAHAQPVMRVRAQLAGADGVLGKPLDHDELLRQLANVGLATLPVVDRKARKAAKAAGPGPGA